MPRRWFPGQRAQYDEHDMTESASYCEQYMRENRLTTRQMARLMRCSPDSITALLRHDPRSTKLIPALREREQRDPVAPAAPGIDTDYRSPERYGPLRRWHTTHGLRLTELGRLLGTSGVALIALWDIATAPAWLAPALDELDLALQIAANEPETYATIRAWRIKRGIMPDVAASTVGSTPEKLRYIETGPAPLGWRAAMARHDLRRTLDAST